MEEPLVAFPQEEDKEKDDEEEDNDDGKEQDDAQRPALQKTKKQTAVKKRAKSNSKSSSSEETGSESESDSEPEQTLKAEAKKTMEENVTAATPGLKRANETVKKESKRAKKKGADLDEEDQKKPIDDTKKQLFQRVWSDEDEIALLKGMIEYWTKREVNPSQDMNVFHDYIKKSLHADVSKAQLVDKIKRLKKKYENKVEKAFQKDKQHEQKAYDLSKKLWGSESTSGVLIESAAKSNGKSKKIQTNKSLAAELLEGDNDEEGNGVLVNLGGKAGLEEFLLNDGLDMLEGVKKAKLRKRWSRLQIAQLELFVQRKELIKEQTEMILDAMKSSGN